MKNTIDSLGLRRVLPVFLCVMFVSLALRAGAQQPASSSEGSKLSVSDSKYRQVITEGSKSLNLYLNYPQGSAKVLPEFGNNEDELTKLDVFIHQVFRDSLIYVDSIRLTGYCSIEGSYGVNERLAKTRAVGLKTYLDNRYQLSSRYPVRVNWIAEDWAELRKLVAASHMAYRDEVLYLIDNVGIFAGREKKLMDLANGAPYKYMLKEFFPALRRVEVTVNYDLRRIIEQKLQRKLTQSEFEAELARERAEAEAEERRLAELSRMEESARLEAERQAREAERLEALHRAEEEARVQAQRRAEMEARLEAQRRAEEEARIEAERQAQAAAKLQRKEQRKLKPIVAFKTDLVAWAGVLPDFTRTTFMPNLEAEFYFAKRWSVGVSGLYANWDYKGGKQFWGYTAYSIEPRIWFKGNGLFRGVYMGLYGQIGDFNKQVDRVDEETTLTNFTGDYWSAGLSVGYMLPLSRHWCLELSVRGGYRSATYDRYDRELPNYYWASSGEKNEFALTGIRFNVVYRIGRGKR